jgi:regulator of RNase E activity RraA
MPQQPIPGHVIEALRGVSTATITTILFARGYRNAYMHGVEPLSRSARSLVGPAFTLRYIPAREDLDTLESFRGTANPQRRAIEDAPAGSVLVIDARKEMRAAAAGAILCTRLKQRGVAGLVTDGGLRDADAIGDLGFAAYCAGPSAPTNLTCHHPVDVNLPVACGDVAVFPGDIVVADGDGVVVVPHGLAEEVAEQGLEMTLLEAFLAEQIATGRELFGTYPPNEATMARYEDWKARRRARATSVETAEDGDRQR